MRKDKPKAKEIIEKSKKMILMKDKAYETELKGKKMKFTPAEVDKKKTIEELEEGVVIGVLENELPGDETNLPAGKHNIFATKINDKWYTFAESNGQVYEAAKTKSTILSADEIPDKKMKFSEDGWLYCGIRSWYEWKYVKVSEWYCQWW